MRSWCLPLCVVALALGASGCPKTTRPHVDASTDDASEPPDTSPVDAAEPPDASAEDDAAVPAEILLNVDFQSTPTGSYFEPQIAIDWPGMRWASASRATIVDEGGERFVRILYPTGTWGTAANGAQWQVGLEEPHEELWLRYRLRFREGFDGVLGGKLPGLIGGDANTGGEQPDGSDGWSARMMWRSGLSVEQYVYHPDQPGTFGEDFPWSIDDTVQHFTTGVWHTVEHRIVMNTPGAHDGIIQGWLDGELAMDVRDFRFRDVDTLAIDGLYFSTFFGGSSAEWAATRDETIDFDDFVISVGRAP